MIGDITKKVHIPEKNAPGANHDLKYIFIAKEKTVIIATGNIYALFI